MAPRFVQRAQTHAQAVEEAMTHEERLVWRRFEQLEQRVLTQGEALELSVETRALLSGGARLVKISPGDTEDALRGVSTATTLLREIGRRIRDGSLRLGKVDSQVDALRDKGDFAGARKVIEETLAAEVVPHYRGSSEPWRSGSNRAHRWNSATTCATSCGGPLLPWPSARPKRKNHSRPWRAPRPSWR